MKRNAIRGNQLKMLKMGKFLYCFGWEVRRVRVEQLSCLLFNFNFFFSLLLIEIYYVGQWSIEIEIEMMHKIKVLHLTNHN